MHHHMRSLYNIIHIAIYSIRYVVIVIFFVAVLITLQIFITGQEVHGKLRVVGQRLILGVRFRYGEFLKIFLFGFWDVDVRHFVGQLLHIVDIGIRFWFDMLVLLICRMI